MASLLDQLQAKRDYDQDTSLAGAASRAGWAANFKSPEEQQAANINLDDSINRAVQRKLELQGQQDLKSAFDYARLKEVQARTQHDADMAPLDIRAAQAQIEGNITRERAAARVDTLKARAAQQEAQDMEGFHSDLDQGMRTARIGTPEYADLLTRTRLKYPGVPSPYFDDLWKATARSPLSSEDAVKFAADKALAIKQATETPAADRIKFEVDKAKALDAAKPQKDTLTPSLERERALHAKMLDRAKRLRSKATDADVIADADKDIMESEASLADVESQIRTLRQTGSTTAAPKVPEPGEVRGGWKFKGGDPADKNNWEK